jgi:predicted RNase H-like HicB family nuclease/uncharacterized damage-inducible protein DinB
MKIYRVYIETSQEAIDEGGPLAHVPELPGCTARARTVEGVKEAIRQTAHDYIAFLRVQGERGPLAGSGQALPDEFDLEFEETQSYTLPPDYAPMTAEEIVRAKRWLEASRSAVLAELADLPAEAWDWKPGENDWPLRGVIGHLGAAELYLTYRLKEPERAPLDHLQVTRRVALDRLNALTPENLGRVTRYEGEDWTPRKVVRRMLEHEQEHLAQIRAMISQYRSSAT